MKEITTPHNNFFQSQMNNLDIAKSLLKNVLPPMLLRKIDLNALEIKNNTFIDKTLKKLETDVLIKAKFDDTVGYVYLLCEHQRNPDKLMPFRLLEYTIAIMKKHLTEYNTSVLPIVYPFILYQGDKPYNYSLDLFDLFHPAQISMAKDILLQPSQLINLCSISDEEFETFNSAAIMLLAMKHVVKGDIVVLKSSTFIASFTEKYGQAPVEEAIIYMYLENETKDKRKFADEIITAFPSYKDKIMTIAEQLRQEGEQKGIQQGLQQGAEQKAREVALVLLRKHLDLQTISEATELPITVIKEIQAQNKIEH